MMMWWFLSSSRSYKLKSPNTMAPPDSVASGREQRVAEIQAIMEGLSQPPQSSLPPAHVLSSDKTEVYYYFVYYRPEESLGVVAIFMDIIFEYVVKSSSSNWTRDLRMKHWRMKLTSCKRKNQSRQCNT